MWDRAWPGAPFAARVIIRCELYALTDDGRDALWAWARDPDATPEQVRDEGLLKIFAGGDPEAILAARIAYHREKLAELEGYLAALRAEPARARRWRGAEVTLVIGIAYHRDMIGLIECFLEEGIESAHAVPSPPARSS
jgi:Virulence activator alpha C-term